MTLSDLALRVGTELGVSPWRMVSQPDIKQFADLTDDHQWIHVDPVRAAAETPFGGTIAHGFLTLSLLPALAREALPPLDGVVMGINYGFDRVRFVQPVPSGSRVRGRYILAELKERRPGEWLRRYAVTVEIAPREPNAEPGVALSADWLTIVRFSR